MNGTPVTVVALLKAKPGMEDKLRQELMALIGPTRLEAACINYYLHQSLDNPGHFVFYENWQSREDLDAHLQKPHLTAFLAQGAQLLSEPPQITLWEKLA
jgi:quinol monooxygenase YgiN